MVDGLNRACLRLDVITVSGARYSTFNGFAVAALCREAAHVPAT